MIPFSVLDLAPIVEGGDAAQALKNSLDLARHAERWGYRRVWLAEHHNMPGIASSATAVAIAHVAGGTQTIRVGAGGIMLPNHAPLVIAEQFGTLESLFPGRIDLALGRAPGTDQLTARALRYDAQAADAFPDEVLELMHYFQPVEPGQRVRAGLEAFIEKTAADELIVAAQVYDHAARLRCYEIAAQARDELSRSRAAPPRTAASRSAG